MIILSFSDTGSGLSAKGGDRLGHFAIAGADQTRGIACGALHNEITG